MVGLLLAPYNDSMRLGQGFNSFLQEPCINNAVRVDDDRIITHRSNDGDPAGVSQVVSYSSRFVERISDVVRSMNISAGSSIKNGSIEVSGSSLSVDESKFAASDLNAVVSVKVVNQTTKLQDDAIFTPIEDVKYDSEKFHDIYGDCFVSGFIEGGDLHGIVSIKVLDASKKRQIESSLKGQINNAASEFSLSSTDGHSTLDAALSQTETTISVNWSGGGQIKSESEEWSLGTLFKAAAAFPANVAACPQRTWAILTKYDNNRHFIKWAEAKNIKVKQYSNVQRYTADLLDNYMEYKNNLAILQGALADPKAYMVSPVTGAVNVSVEALVIERKKMKKQMADIVAEIDALNSYPWTLQEVEEKSQIEAPEVWATKLPIRKSASDSDSYFNVANVAAEMALFPILDEPAPVGPSKSEPEGEARSGGETPAPTQQAPQATAQAATPEVTTAALPALCHPDILRDLQPSERAWVETEDHRRAYGGKYSIDRAIGNPEDGAPNFVDCETLAGTSIPTAWPSRMEVRLVSWGSESIVGWIQLLYDQVHLTHGSEKGQVVSTLILEMAPDEKITSVKLRKGDRQWGVEGVAFMEVQTSNGQVKSVGNCGNENEVVKFWTQDWGLKGFYGRDGDVVDRLGLIWGRGV